MAIMNFQSILSLAQKCMFFTPTFTKNSNNVLSFCYGPSGSLFMENIKSEWTYSNVINRDASVFIFMDLNTKNVDHRTHYVNTRDNCDKQLPFGIAKVYTECFHEENNGSITESTYFSPLKRTCYSSEMYLTPSAGNHYFLHWQRQRKLWWKKICYSPSRFSLGEIYKAYDGCPSVNILVRFPWGNQVLETISMSQLNQNTEVDLSARIGRKSVLPVVIKNTLSIEAAVIGLFCDAFDKQDESKTPVLRIHRKLSPYKCMISINVSESTMKDEVSMLAFSLVKQLRKSGISTMQLPHCNKLSLSSQFHRNDEWGIPFTIILDSASLTTGVINIRDRDTTLNEEVHVSEVANYMKQLIRNF